MTMKVEFALTFYLCLAGPECPIWRQSNFYVLSVTHTHTHNTQTWKALPPNPTPSFLNLLVYSPCDSVSIDVVVVSIKTSVMQINFLLRGEVEARTGGGSVE